MHINDYTIPEAHLPQRSSKGHFSKYTVNVACKNCSGSFMFFSVFCLLCHCARLFICALGSPAGIGLTSWLSFVVSNCE